MHEFDVISIWPDWEIVDLLGKGKYGEVYYARKTEDGDVFYSAIKVINLPYHTELSAKAVSLGMKTEYLWEYFRKFKNDLNWELTIAKMFHSPHILPVDEVYIRENLDSIGWQVFVRTGIFNTLDDFLEERTVSKETAIRLGLDILKAMSVCDSSGSVHGEIKPSNILVSEDGGFMLRDFGIRRCLEKAGSALFGEDSRVFDAPEVRASGEYSVASDIYSLGLVLSYALNGCTIPEKAAEQEDAGLSAVIGKATAQNPHDRYQTAGEFTAALEDLLVGKPKDAPAITEEEAELLEEELSAAEEAAEVLKGEPEETAFQEAPEASSAEPEETAVFEPDEAEELPAAPEPAKPDEQTAQQEEPETEEKIERQPEEVPLPEGEQEAFSGVNEPEKEELPQETAAAEEPEGVKAEETAETNEREEADVSEPEKNADSDIEKMVRLELLEESMFSKNNLPAQAAEKESESAYEEREDNGQEKGDKEKERGKKRGGMVVLLILLLAAAAAALYFAKPWTYLNLGDDQNASSGQSVAAAAGIFNGFLLENGEDIMDLADSADIAVPKSTGYIPENIPAPQVQEEEEPAGDSYILPTDTEKITKDDLAGMSRSETYMVINEIYARHGKIFHTPSIQAYFEEQSWYEPYSQNSEDITPLFNDIERANVGTVTAYQREMGYR